jgi:3-oxoacyl-[acyl-carrier protein] reductase
VLLEGKNAVIYGAGGSIGSAVARAFTREGAGVHLAGRRAESLEALAEELRDDRDDRGAATVAAVDALDEQAVDRHAADVVANAGSIDICLNVISHGEVFGTPLADISLADYERPIHTATRSTFLTRQGGRTPHGPEALRSDPHLRRLWATLARLLPRRLPGRPERRRRIEAPTRS